MRNSLGLQRLGHSREVVRRDAVIGGEAVGPVIKSKAFLVRRLRSRDVRRVVRLVPHRVLDLIVIVGEVFRRRGSEAFVVADSEREGAEIRRYVFEDWSRVVGASTLVIIIALTVRLRKRRTERQARNRRPEPRRDEEEAISSLRDVERVRTKCPPLKLEKPSARMASTQTPKKPPLTH